MSAYEKNIQEKIDSLYEYVKTHIQEYHGLHEDWKTATAFELVEVTKMLLEKIKTDTLGPIVKAQAAVKTLGKCEICGSEKMEIYQCSDCGLSYCIKCGGQVESMCTICSADEQT